MLKGSERLGILLEPKKEQDSASLSHSARDQLTHMHRTTKFSPKVRSTPKRDIEMTNPTNKAL
jgi:hypothetical protein